MKRSSKSAARHVINSKICRKYHESGVKDAAIERAELAARAAAIEAATRNREQDRQV